MLSASTGDPLVYYILNPQGVVCDVRNPDQEYTQADRAKAVEMGYEIKCDWDIPSWQVALQVAEEATKAMKVKYLAVDRGPNHSPRYGATEMPRIGMEVSKAVNGDYYPEGKVIKVSASGRRVETDTGVVFWRRNDSASWIHRGVWSMVRGHISELNPSF